MSKKVFTITSDPKYLAPLRSKLGLFFKKVGYSEQNYSPFLVAVGEACTNAIRHAYLGEKGHKIQITVLDDPKKTVIKIRDYGAKIDLSRIKTPDLPPQKPGGLGIYFMKTVMDQLKYNTSHSLGNELILIKQKKKRESH